MGNVCLDNSHLPHGSKRNRLEMLPQYIWDMYTLMAYASPRAVWNWFASLPVDGHYLAYNYPWGINELIPIG